MSESSNFCQSCGSAVEQNSSQCESCGLRPDTQSSKKKSRILPISIAVLAISGLAASIIFQSPLGQTINSQIANTNSSQLENGVFAPNNPENSFHGASLEQGQIPTATTCEEWELSWLYEGPAVSFASANQYGDSGMSVSTEIYVENKHLDEDGDGIVCFYENRKKPDINSASKDWLQAFDAVWSYLDSNSAESYPIDFAVSPSTLPENADVIRRGVEQSLQEWAPFISSQTPLPVTVVHPDDKDWFQDRWSKLGGTENSAGWFDSFKETGGGGVSETTQGIPHMHFMILDSNPPKDGPVDFYFHETTHFFESSTSSYDKISPCWAIEGPASFIGFSKTQPDDKDASAQTMSAIRRESAMFVFDFYSDQGGFTEKAALRLTKDLTLGDPQCQFEWPAFGYNVGMFIAEKFIIDFGFQGFLDLVAEFNSSSLPQAFFEVTGVDYEEWITNEAATYVFREINTLNN